MEILTNDWIFIASLAAAGLGLAALSLAYGLPSRLKAGLWILRLLALALLLALAGEIRWRSGGKNRPGTLHVAVDVSKSMEDDKAVLEKTLEHLSSWARSRRVELKYHRFDSKPTALDNTSQIFKNAFREEKSAIGSSLRRLESTLAQNAPLLLLTDGVETQEWSPPATTLTIFALPFGGDLGQDAALEEAHFPPVVFARGDVPFKITVRYPPGLKEPSEVIIKDKTGGDILWQGTINPSGLSPEEFSFTMKAPALTGTRQLEVELKPYRWEKSTANNKLTLTTEILREKLRILYLCGKPTLDYGYLREYLRSAHGRELVSFVILRNPEDAPPYGESELSLIPFPAHDIFTTTLGEFDLFILQDFSLARFALPAAYMDHIRQFIVKGGGFIFLSGSNTARSTEFHSYPLQNSPEGFLKNLFGLTQDPAAQPNPWTESSGAAFKIQDPKTWLRIFPYETDAAKNTSLWQDRLSPLYAFEALRFSGSSSVKPSVLAELEASGKRYPAMVASDIGKGRAVWIGFSGSWIWKSGAAMSGNLSDLYDTFWQNLAAWTTHGEAQERPMKAVLELEGEALRVILNLGSNPGKPQETLSGEILPSRQPLILRQKSEGSNTYEGMAPNTAVERIAVWIGGRKVEIKASMAGGEREEMRMSVDLAYLRSLADKNQGQVLGLAQEWRDGVPAQSAQILDDASRKVSDPAETLTPGPWHKFMETPWPAILAVILLSLEWFLRRRLGISA